MGTLLILLALASPAWAFDSEAAAQRRADRLETWYGAQAEAQEDRRMRQRDAEVQHLREAVEALQRRQEEEDSPGWLEFGE